jgi:hypothetical protein
LLVLQSLVQVVFEQQVHHIVVLFDHEILPLAIQKKNKIDIFIKKRKWKFTSIVWSVARDDRTRLSALDACSVDETEKLGSPLLIFGVETLLRWEIKLSKLVFSFNVVSPVKRERVSWITIRNRSGSSDSRA